MELENLKELWAKSATQPTASAYQISELIYRDSNSPLAVLEKKFRSALYIFPAVIILFAGKFIKDGYTGQSITMWLLFGILFSEFLFSLLNYRLLKRLREPSGNIRENLLKRVFLLQRRNHNYLYLHTGLYIVMAALLELSIHFNFDNTQNWWGNIALPLRLIICLAFVTGEYFIKKHSQKKLYGQYIDRLNDLISQMD
ncbi:MAG TPA: hypothetical protein VHA56_04815 [Mucilaginibacter sp.]|nr:hypothetical protein [Mucilaginibacter sp.]